jgi:hypothetical protein
MRIVTINTCLNGEELEYRWVEKSYRVDIFKKYGNVEGEYKGTYYLSIDQVPTFEEFKESVPESESEFESYNVYLSHIRNDEKLLEV